MAAMTRFGVHMCLYEKPKVMKIPGCSTGEKLYYETLGSESRNIWSRNATKYRGHCDMSLASITYFV